MRADAATARDLHEIAELLSSEFVKASMADALRAVVKVGSPILRERLAKERAPSAQSIVPPASSVPAQRKSKRKPTP